jgi:hypothetical protein
MLAHLGGQETCPVLRGRFRGEHNLPFAFAAQPGGTERAPGGGCPANGAELYIQASPYYFLDARFPLVLLPLSQLR